MNVAVLYIGSINEPTGAGKIVRSFSDNKTLYKSHDVDITVYDRKIGFVKPSFGNYNGFSGKLRLFLKRIVISTPSGSDWFAKRVNSNAIKIVDEYLNSGKKADVLVFHETTTCYEYINRCKNHNQNVGNFILVMHTNGELFKMFYTEYPNLSKKYKKEIERRADICMQDASRLVFVAETAANNYKKTNSKYAKKVEVVHNGIADRICNNPVFDGSIRIVTVGTVNKRKNQILQIECLGDIIKKGVNVMLTIVGSGEALDYCKRRASELGIERFVTFTGAFHDVPAILDKCNLFVMSSYDEGLPISAIEALRNKLPLILTDVGGNKELIEKNGFLINPNKGELTNAILEFSKDVERQKLMSQKSYELFKSRFTINSMVNKYSDIIKSVNGCL